jgi:hypothetical protein
MYSALLSDEQIINKKQCSNTEMNLQTKQNNIAAKKLEYASTASERELSYEVEQWLKFRYKVIYYTRGKPLLVDIWYHNIFYYTNGIL